MFSVLDLCRPDFAEWGKEQVRLEMEREDAVQAFKDSREKKSVVVYPPPPPPAPPGATDEEKAAAEPFVTMRRIHPGEFVHLLPRDPV